MCCAASNLSEGCIMSGLVLSHIPFPRQADMVELCEIDADWSLE